MLLSRLKNMAFSIVLASIGAYSSDAGSKEGEGNASASDKAKAAWSPSVGQSGKHSLDQHTASCFRI